jgi:hypothetical protein
MRANKNFFVLISENAVFLHVCLGCCIKDVCWSCLLNKTVNQHNPYALVIMLLFMLLAIFQKHYLSNLSFSKIILFVQNKSQYLSLKQCFYQS